MTNANSPESAEQTEAQRSESEMTSRQRADQLMTHLNKDKAINEIFGDSFERQYLIYGKSPRAWRQYFRITIPESPDTSQCKAIAAKVAALMQDASFYYAAAEAQLDALTSGQSKEYTTAFNKVIAEFKAAGKNPPATNTIKEMASKDILDIN